ncbi:MAG: energy transducer TonB [Gemmatimonadales bacterium]
MKRLLWVCAAIVGCVAASGPAVARAQGATTCDSPCKVIHLPLVGPRGAVCDSPCKLEHLPLVRRNDQPVPTSNPLKELEGKVSGANTVHFEYQVDKPAVPAPMSASPQYPDSLKAAKVEGEVVASFVVDTLGLADPTSLRILKSTNPLFAGAVRDALPLMVFIPAELAGVKVRQVVQRSFTFTLPH